MKKLLGLLTIAPMALTACGDTTPAEDPSMTYTSYAYAFGGSIARADVTVKGTKIIEVKLDETYNVADSAEFDYKEIDAAGVTAAENKFKEEIDLKAVAAPADKGLCLTGQSTYDGVRPAFGSGFDTTKVGAIQVAMLEGTDMGGGNSVTKTDCEADSGGSPFGMWLAAGEKVHAKADAYTPVYDFDKIKGYANSHGSLNKNDLKATDVMAAEDVKMKNSKIDSFAHKGVEYNSRGTKKWKESIDAITKYFVDEGADISATNLWSRKLSFATYTNGAGIETTTPDGSTGITGATLDKTDRYAKVIQAAIKKAINA